MGAIVIKADNASNKILSELVKKLGGKALSINEEQLEDLLLGNLMTKSKTGSIVSREKICKNLELFEISIR